jgi:hypothetical protein
MAASIGWLMRSGRASGDIGTPFQRFFWTGKKNEPDCSGSLVTRLKRLHRGAQKSNEANYLPLSELHYQHNLSANPKRTAYQL